MRALAGCHVILICKGVDCHERGRQILEESLFDELGVRRGQTTHDGRFHLQLTDCLDICERAPAMSVDGDYHGPVHPENLPAILAAYE